MKQEDLDKLVLQYLHKRRRASVIVRELALPVEVTAVRGRWPMNVNALQLLSVTVIARR